jgi:hypothetical protein
MTPKEKAKKMVEIYTQVSECGVWNTTDVFVTLNKKLAKQCALISVDEILKIVPSIYVTKDEEINNGHYQYWQEVKQEIEK